MASWSRCVGSWSGKRLTSAAAALLRCNRRSKAGGRREISHGMALQWWLHDVALEQPALRPTFSWHWTESAEGLERGQATFSALLELLHSRAEGYAQSNGEEPEQAEAQLIAIVNVGQCCPLCGTRYVAEKASPWPQATSGHGLMHRVHPGYDWMNALAVLLCTSCVHTTRYL